MGLVCSPFCCSVLETAAATVLLLTVLEAEEEELVVVVRAFITDRSFPVPLLESCAEFCRWRGVRRPSDAAADVWPSLAAAIESAVPRPWEETARAAAASIARLIPAWAAAAVAVGCRDDDNAATPLLAEATQRSQANRDVGATFRPPPPSVGSPSRARAKSWTVIRDLAVRRDSDVQRSPLADTRS